MARPKKPAEEPIRPPWFKFWNDWAASMELLSNEQAGELLKAMVSFSIDGIEPSFEDGLLKACWSFMVIQIKLDRQKYINQVKSNREAGRISAKNKSKKTQKKLYQKNGVSVDGNADGTTDSEQVLTSVNEGKKERRKEDIPKEPKEQEKTKKEVDEDFDSDGYNMANDLWYKNNGRKTLTPAEKKYLRECVNQHGAEFICGCIGILIHDEKPITTKELRNTIADQKAKEEKRKAEEHRQQWEGADDRPKSIFGGYYE